MVNDQKTNEEINWKKKKNDDDDDMIDVWMGVAQKTNM